MLLIVHKDITLCEEACNEPTSPGFAIMAHNIRRPFRSELDR